MGNVRDKFKILYNIGLNGYQPSPEDISFAPATRS